MTGATYPNHVRQGLAGRRAVLTIEVSTPPATEPFEQAIGPVLALAHETRQDPRVDAIALTDRSRTDHDHDPLLVGHRVAEESGKVPIVHWAGKDRTAADLDRDLRRAEALGLQTLLLVTGDKIRKPPAHRPVRYLDSVHALVEARKRTPEFLLAAAVSPFKYREEELMSQYLKALKKLRAGADFLMTQIGWDLCKYEELRDFLAWRGYRGPLMAELLLLTPARSRLIRRGSLAGVTLTEDFARRLEEDAGAPDRGRSNAFRRLALQVVGVRDLGYAGVQVSGIRTHPNVARLLDEIEAVGRMFPTREARAEAWRELMMLRDGRLVQVAPAAGRGLALPSAAGGSQTVPARRGGAGEWVTFRAMDLIDRVFFKEGTVVARAIAPALRRLAAPPEPGGMLVRLEHAIKGPLVGCQTCGFCRLPQTAYVCAETCPKGLANGPCGGTRDNVCEFGDRECIHNRIYRIAKRTGGLSLLEEQLIPQVPQTAWGRCSWTAHFQDEGPHAERLPPLGPGLADQSKDAGETGDPR